MKRKTTTWLALLALCMPLALLAQPANDNPAGAVPITPSAAGTGCSGPTFTLPFSTDGTTDSGNDNTCNGTSTGLDNFFTWTATSDGLLWNDQAPGNPGIAIYADAGGALGAEIDCAGTFAATDFILSGWAVGDALIIQIFDYGSSVSDVAFCLEEYTLPPAAANNDCANATVVTDGGAVSTPGPVNTATFSPGNTDSGEGAPCGAGTYAGGDVFFSYEASSASIGVDLLTTTGSPYLEVYSGSCGGLLGTDVYCSNFLSTSTQELIGGLTPGQTYIFRIFESGNDAFGDITFTVTTLPPPPTNDVCAGAIPANVGAPQSCFTGSTGANSYSVDFSTVTDSGDGTPDCDGATNFDLWYTWTATTDRLQFSSGTGAPGIQLYTGTCGSLTGVPNGCLNNTGGIIEGLTVGTDYIIQIWDDSQGANPVEWCLAEGPQCINPSGFSVSNITASGADINFTSNNSGSTASVLVCPAGTTTNCFGPFTGTPDPTTGAVTVTATGLPGGTAFDAFGQDDCGSSQSQFVGPVSFTTLNTPPPGPNGITCTSGGSAAAAYADELDDLANWTGDIGTSGGQWRAGSSTVSSGTGAGSPQSGAAFIYFEGSGGAGATGTITTGPIDLSTFEDDAEVSFYIHAYGGYIGTFDMSAASDPAGPFTSIFSSSGAFQGANSDPWIQVGGNVGSYVGGDLYLQISHTALANGSGSDWTSDFSVDNLVIEACAPAGVCSDPTGIAAVSIGGGAVDVTFTGSSAAIGYDVEYGVSGFTPGTGTVVSGTASPIQITGLAGSTTYDVYVTADCGRGSVSSQVGPVSVTLGPDNDFCAGAIPATFIGAQGAGTSTTLPFTTDGTTDSGVPAVCSSPGLDQYFTWTATTAGLLFTSETPGSPGIAVFASCADVDAGNDIACLNTFGTGSLSGWAVGDDVIIQIYDFNGSSSDVAFTLEEFTPPTPPANDECDNAVALTVNPDDQCGATTAGTTAGGTASPQTDDVTGTPNDDVWYSFVATDTEHIVSLLNATNVGGGTSTDLGMGLYDGTGGCAGLVLVDDSDPEVATFSGLTVGTTYILRVYSWSTTAQAIDFDVCVGTLPPPPSNDDCANAIALTDAGGNPTAANGGSYSTVSATASSQTGTCTAGTSDDDVWFAVTVPTAGNTVTITVTGGPTFDAVIGVYTGSCAGLTQVASCVDNSASSGGTEVFTFTSSFTGGGNGQSSRAAPTTYLVQVYDWSAGLGGQFTIEVEGAIALPVELSHFAARAVGDANVVEWVAATEQDLYMYTVERATSLNGFNAEGDFDALADVAPTGTDNGIEAAYSATDARPAATTYYRLRAEDLDGSVEYSEVVVVTRADGGADLRELTLQPNPASNAVDVQLPSDSGAADNRDLVVTDLAGRVVARRTVDASAVRVRLDVSGFQAGVYSVSVVGAEGVTSARLVVE